MREYLSKSIANLNQNKLRGLLAEVDLRTHLSGLGYAGRVSPGGWIARTKGSGIFGHSTIALFPEALNPSSAYPADRAFPVPAPGLHTICATLHQSGISSFFCAATVSEAENPLSLEWKSVQLGLPTEQPYAPLADGLADLGFVARLRPFNFLRYAADVAEVPDTEVPGEFAKEHLRVAFNRIYMAEISDIDGFFLGNQFTHLLEVKEITPADSADMGQYFGLDVGPFVKLAFYAAKRGNLHLLFVVREINNEIDRNLVQWLFITFDDLARYASWGSQSGDDFSIVCIPKAEFRPLNAENLSGL
jgi:hypothetical protein